MKQKPNTICRGSLRECSVGGPVNQAALETLDSCGHSARSWNHQPSWMKASWTVTQLIPSFKGCHPSFERLWIKSVVACWTCTSTISSIPSVSSDSPWTLSDYFKSTRLGSSWKIFCGLCVSGGHMLKTVLLVSTVLNAYEGLPVLRLSTLWPIKAAHIYPGLFSYSKNVQNVTKRKKKVVQSPLSAAWVTHVLANCTMFSATCYTRPFTSLFLLPSPPPPPPAPRPPSLTLCQLLAVLHFRWFAGTQIPKWLTTSA